MAIRSLSIQQLNDKMLQFNELGNISIPPAGWVRAIRNALGITLIQLGDRLKLTKQSAQDIERREKEGTITLNALRGADSFEGRR